MYYIHPAARIFPLMSAQEFAGLKSDIQAHGLHEPILRDVTGAVIDGRNRLRACEELGIEPTFRTFEGESVVEMVMSLNLHRRHLDESQRAMIGAKAKPLFEAEAAFRRRATQNNDAAKAVTANLRELDQPRHESTAAAQAARSVNVSPRSVESAATVLKKGTPELVERVESGEIKVSTAAEVAKQPEPEQQRLAALPIKELRAELKKLDPRPTPAEARKQAIEKGVPVAANNGIYILPMSKEKEDELGRYAVETRGLYDAVTLIADCDWTPEKFVAASEKWTCLEMERRIFRAYDFLERVMSAYARGKAVAVGN